MKLFLVLILSTVFVFGCSKSPKQYGKEGPARNDYKPGEVPHLQTDLDIVTKPSPGENQEGGKDYDAQIKINSSQPILFKAGVSDKTGAAGITFKTTLDEAKKILSKPTYGPDSRGYTLYNESLFIQWRLEEPQTPEFISIQPGYLGQMIFSNQNQPAEVEKIGLGYNFSSLFKTKEELEMIGEPEGAEFIAQFLYVKLFPEQAGINCLQSGVCSVDWGTEEQKEFFISFPGMVFNISKDRFVLFIMAITKLNPLGLFDNDLDVILGQFAVAGAQPAKLGDVFGDLDIRQKQAIKEQMKVDVEVNTDVSYDAFGRDYSGAYISYKKTVFDRLAKKPVDTDPVNFFRVTLPEYQKLILLNSQKIIVTETKKSVELSSVESKATVEEKNTADEKVQLLRLRLGLLRSNVKAFSQKLLQLIEQKVKDADPQAKVSARLTGQFVKKEIKDYSGTVTSYNQQLKKGVQVLFTVREESGDIAGFVVREIGENVSTFDTSIFANFTDSVVKETGSVPVLGIDGKPVLQNGKPVLTTGLLPQFTSLAGLQIGDVIRVKNWDLGRMEADLELLDKTGAVKMAARGRYQDISAVAVAWNTEKITYQNQALFVVGSAPLSIGGEKVQEITISETQKLMTSSTERLYKIVMLESPAQESSIQGLCSGSFNPYVGMSEKEFLTQLKTQPGCVYLPEYDLGGSGRLLNMYFPNDQLRLNFEDQELQKVRVYAPTSEGK